jgi:hypothetical protein
MASLRLRSGKDRRRLSWCTLFELSTVRLQKAHWEYQTPLGKIPVRVFLCLPFSDLCFTLNEKQQCAQALSPHVAGMARILQVVLLSASQAPILRSKMTYMQDSDNLLKTTLGLSMGAGVWTVLDFGSRVFP